MTSRTKVCGDFHRDADVPDYCEGCGQHKNAHADSAAVQAMSATLPAPVQMKRYTQPCVQLDLGEVPLFEDPAGKWVRYEDVVAMCERVAAILHGTKVAK